MTRAESSTDSQGWGATRRRWNPWTKLAFVSVAIVGIILVFIEASRLSTAYPPEMKFRKAAVEILNVEMAFQKLCGDAEVKSLRELFADSSSLDRSDLKSTITAHTEIAYKVLRNGRNADCTFAPGVKQRLGTLYMDLPSDPWGHPYQFLFLPWPDGGIGKVKTDPFLQYRGTAIRGNIPPNNAQSATPLAYIISMGPNGELDTIPTSEGNNEDTRNSDDIINIYDSESWSRAWGPSR